MLIYSQARFGISEIDTIAIDGFGNCYVVSGDSQDKKYILGQYKTEDRAKLEIKSIVEFFNGNTGRQIYIMTEDK